MYKQHSRTLGFDHGAEKSYPTPYALNPKHRALQGVPMTSVPTAQDLEARAAFRVQGVMFFKAPCS